MIRIFRPALSIVLASTSFILVSACQSSTPSPPPHAASDRPTAANPASNAFAGVWRVDAARSQQHTEPVRYEDLGGGRMRLSAAGVSSYEFAIDGKEHRRDEHRTVAWTPIAPGQWQMTLRFDGKVVETARWTLSADGKTANVVATGTLPNGTPYRHDRRFERDGTGSSLAGAWRNVEMNTNDMPDGYVLTETSPGVIVWSIPTDHQTITGKWDGSEMPLVGATAPKGTTLAVQRVSERHVTYTMSTNGAIGQHGRMTLSADGEIMTEESWPPGKENQKSTTVYVRLHCPPPATAAREGAPSAAKAPDMSDPNWLCTVR